jgi:hypothetical protein
MFLQDSSVHTVTTLQAGHSGILFPASAGEFSPKRPDQLWPPPKHPIQWLPGFFPWGKQIWHEASHLHGPTAEVRNVWSYIATPPIFPHSIHRDFTFILLLQYYIKKLQSSLF